MASANASNTAMASMYWRVMVGLSSSISVYFVFLDFLPKSEY